MHLLKNHHDYYDSVVGYNKEDPVKYHRLTEQFEGVSIPEIARAKAACWHSMRRGFHTFLESSYGDECILSVAGKAFCGYVVNEQKDPEMYRLYMSTGGSESKRPHFVYDKKSYLRAFPEEKLLTDDLAKFFVGIGQLSHMLDLEELHQRYKSPVLRITPHSSMMYSRNAVGALYNVEKDPNLQLLNFQKVMDPFTISQEIEMYIGGVLGNNTPPPKETSDVDRLIAKGFDTRISFRHRK